MKKYLAEYRRRQKSKKEPINKLRKIHDELDVHAEAVLQKHLLELEKSPEFQNLSPQDQAEVKQCFLLMRKWIVKYAHDLENRMEEYYREIKLQLPVVIEKIYRDACLEVKKEYQQLVEKEMKRIIEGLTEDQRFELWKLAHTGKLVEKFLESSTVKEISVTRRERRKHE